MKASYQRSAHTRSVPSSEKSFLKCENVGLKRCICKTKYNITLSINWNQIILTVSGGDGLNLYSHCSFRAAVALWRFPAAPCVRVLGSVTCTGAGPLAITCLTCSTELLGLKAMTSPLHWLVCAVSIFFFLPELKGVLSLHVSACLEAK